MSLTNLQRVHTSIIKLTKDSIHCDSNQHTIFKQPPLCSLRNTPLSFHTSYAVIHAYLAIHIYTQHILCPTSYSRILPKNLQHFTVQCGTHSTSSCTSHTYIPSAICNPASTFPHYYHDYFTRHIVTHLCLC